MSPNNQVQEYQKFNSNTDINSRWHKPWTIFWRASKASESDVTKIGLLVITFETIVCSGRKPSAITLVAMSCTRHKLVRLHNHTHAHTPTKKQQKAETETLSVMIPDSKALESVSKTASTRRAAILRHASKTVVPSDIVRAFDSRSFLTVLSPPSNLHNSIQSKTTFKPKHSFNSTTTHLHTP